MTCHSICKRYKTKYSPFKSLYDQSMKRCTHCALFILWDGLFCPCCGYRLRTKPRNSPQRKALLAKAIRY